jgi:Na+-transporting methylmalonyl-CoA/oxaloacetate decarboxylase gamma subunit
MNTFNLSHIGMANLQIDGFDPVSFSFLGMAIVFCGLLIITLYIYILPILLDLPTKLRRRKRSSHLDSNKESGDAITQEREVMVAIAAAFHLYQDFPENNQRITWLSHGVDHPAWLAAGINNGLSRRHTLHTTRRKF